VTAKPCVSSIARNLEQLSRKPALKYKYSNNSAAMNNYYICIAIAIINLNAKNA